MGEIVRIEDAGRKQPRREPAVSPMRMLITRHCQTCSHEWIQPKDGGRCLACRSEDVVTVERRINALARM